MDTGTPGERRRRGARKAAPREGLRDRNKREKQERILAAARALFSERGFEATTTRDIAERAGVGTGTVFLYVRSKEELLLRLFREEIERAQGALFQALPADAPLEEQLMFVFGGLFDLYAENPGLSRTFIKNLLFMAPEVAEQHQSLVQAFMARLAGLVQAAQARGEVDAGVPPATAAVNFFSLYLTTLLAWLDGPAGSQQALRQTLREGLALQRRGLRPANPKRSPHPRSQT